MGELGRALMGGRMLSRTVDHQVCLTCHGVVYFVEARDVWNRLNDRLDSLLKLLAVKVRGCDGLISLASIKAGIQAHASELLSCCLDIHELLLQCALPLRKVGVGCQELVIVALVNLAPSTFDLDGGRCKDVLRKRVDLTTTVQAAPMSMTGEVSTSGGLRNPGSRAGIRVFDALQSDMRVDRRNCG